MKKTEVEHVKFDNVKIKEEDQDAVNLAIRLKEENGWEVVKIIPQLGSLGDHVTPHTAGLWLFFQKEVP